MSARSVRCWPWVNPNPWCRSGGTSKATMTASAVSGSMERTRRGWKMGLMSVTKKGRFTRACNARRVRGSPGTGTAPCRPWRRRRTGTAFAGCRGADRLVSRHRSSVGLRWPSKRIAALHRLPIPSVLAARCALRYAPMAARSLRHLIGDATLAGRAHLGGDQLSTSLADIQAGKLRALAIAAEQRSALLPSVPTLREQGFGGIDIEGWNGLLAPSGTPADILSRLQAAAAGAVRDPQVQQRLQTLGAEPVGSDAQSLDGLLQQQRARFLPMVAQLKLE